MIKISSDYGCCLGIIIVFILIVIGLFVFNPWGGDSSPVYEIPNDVVQFYSLEQEDGPRTFELTTESLEKRDKVSEMEDSNSKTTFYKPGGKDSNESFKILLRFSPDDLKVNGSNNYSYPIKSVLDDLCKIGKNKGYSSSEYASIPQNSNTSMNNVLKSSNIEELNLVLYDKNGELDDVINLTNGHFNIYEDGGKYAGNYTIAYESEKTIGDTPIYHNLGSPDKRSDLPEFIELHIILKSDPNKSSSDYYCYDLKFNLTVDWYSPTKVAYT